MAICLEPDQTTRPSTRAPDDALLDDILPLTERNISRMAASLLSDFLATNGPVSILSAIPCRTPASQVDGSVPLDATIAERYNPDERKEYSRAERGAVRIGHCGSIWEVLQGRGLKKKPERRGSEREATVVNEYAWSLLRICVVAWEMDSRRKISEGELPSVSQSVSPSSFLSNVGLKMVYGQTRSMNILHHSSHSFHTLQRDSQQTVALRWTLPLTCCRMSPGP